MQLAFNVGQCAFSCCQGPFRVGELHYFTPVENPLAAAWRKAVSIFIAVLWCFMSIYSMSCTVLTVLQLYTILRTSIAGIIHVIQTRAAPWYSDVLDVLHPWGYPPSRVAMCLSWELSRHQTLFRVGCHPSWRPSSWRHRMCPVSAAEHCGGRASRANNMAKVAKAEVCVDTALWRRQWRGKLMIPVTCQQALLKFQIYRDVPIPR